MGLLEPESSNLEYSYLVEKHPVHSVFGYGCCCLLIGSGAVAGSHQAVMVFSCSLCSFQVFSYGPLLVSPLILVGSVRRALESISTVSLLKSRLLRPQGKDDIGRPASFPRWGCTLPTTDVTTTFGSSPILRPRALSATKRVSEEKMGLEDSRSDALF